MVFSNALIDAIAAEAAANGLRNATQIAEALRHQLVETRRGGDGRTKAYWVAARVLDKGVSYPMPGAMQIVGWEAIAPLMAQGAATVGSTIPDDAMSAKSIGPLRVALSRKGEAHAQVMLAHCKKPPEAPDAWVDVFVYVDRTRAVEKAASLPKGRVL